jgi:hypothetical protein
LDHHDSHTVEPSEDFILAIRAVMSTLKIIATVFLGLSTLFPQRAYGIQHAASLSMYTKPHSLAGNSFDPRDGWEIANITDLPYKYQRAVNSNNVKTRRGTPLHTQLQVGAQKMPKTASIVDKIKHVVDEVWEGLFGIGELQEAEITWCVSWVFLLLAIFSTNSSL